MQPSLGGPSDLSLLLFPLPGPAVEGKQRRRSSRSSSRSLSASNFELVSMAAVTPVATNRLELPLRRTTLVGTVSDLHFAFWLICCYTVSASPLYCLHFRLSAFDCLQSALRQCWTFRCPVHACHPEVATNLTSLFRQLATHSCKEPQCRATCIFLTLQRQQQRGSGKSPVEKKISHAMEQSAASEALQPRLFRRLQSENKKAGNLARLASSALGCSNPCSCLFVVLSHTKAAAAGVTAVLQQSASVCNAQ